MWCGWEVIFRRNKGDVSEELTIFGVEVDKGPIFLKNIRKFLAYYGETLQNTVFLDAFAKLQKATISFVMFVCVSICLSVRPSAQNISPPTGRISTKFGTWLFSESVLCFLWRFWVGQDVLRMDNQSNEVTETSSRLTLYDHNTNEYIRRELRITGILEKIDEYRRNCLSQLQRMPQNRIPLKSYHYRPQGRRTIGKPKKRCREQP